MTLLTARFNAWETGYQLRRWGLAAGILLAVGVLRLVLYRPPPHSAAYFESTAAAAQATPTHFGAWVSIDAPVPPAAITMLRPNITVSRKYFNEQTGQQASLLLVQCTDAQNLVGHYPPNCYPANGFKLTASSPRDWDVDGLAIQGMEYKFAADRPEDLTSMIIYDFMLLPDRRTCRDMDGVNAIARDPRMRQLGAAQLQVLMDPGLPEDQRDTLFKTLIQANRPAIDAILAGENR